jgi:DNA polymerase
MYTVPLPRIGTDVAWRDAAKRLIGAGISPADVLWDFGGEMEELFAAAAPLPPVTRRIKAPQNFISLANTVVWHKEPKRFARLYAMLWRLRHEPGLMQDRADPELTKLRQMEKGVQRCQNKMKTFLRFCDLRQGGSRRSFAAWFAPTHHTVEPAAPFFARRLADMDWMIATSDITAQFVDGNLSFHPGQPKPDLPEDAAEALWGTYFCNIFNPARLKVGAVTSKMPKQYRQGLSEAQHIQELIAGAENKVRKMQEAAPTLPPEQAGKIKRQSQNGSPKAG